MNDGFFDDVIIETKRIELQCAVSLLIKEFTGQNPFLLAQEITNYFIEQFHDPDRAIADVWSTSDVKIVREDLTEQQAFEVLQEVYFNYDAEVGNNWNIIESQAEELFPSKPVFLLSK